MSKVDKAKQIIAVLLAKVLWKEYENYTRQQIIQRYHNEFKNSDLVNIEKIVDYMIDHGIIFNNGRFTRPTWDEDTNQLINVTEEFYSVKKAKLLNE